MDATLDPLNSMGLRGGDGRPDQRAILEEHAFSEELSEREVPIVAAQRLNDPGAERIYEANARFARSP